MGSADFSREIARVNRELSQLRGKLADEHKREAEKLRRKGQLERGITNSISASTRVSKLRQIERLDKELEKHKSNQASISKQIASKEAKKHDCESRVLRAQEKERREFERKLESRVAGHRLEVHRSITQQQAVVGSPQLVRKHDVFLCHASEDKDSIVRDLANGLRESGLDVWYDDFELKVGDSLRRSIDKGLAASRYGVVVPSSAFFSRNWPQYELDGLVTKETSSGNMVVLPIWHKVSKDEVAKYSPTLADRIALNTGIQGLAEIVQELASVIRPANE